MTQVFAGGLLVSYAKQTLSKIESLKMNSDALEFLLYSATAMAILTLLAVGLFYLNGRLERRQKKRHTVKLQNQYAVQVALSESSVYPQLQPLPSYEEVLQMECLEEMRFKRPAELNVEQLEKCHKNSENTVREMPPPSYQIVVA